MQYAYVVKGITDKNVFTSALTEFLNCKTAVLVKTKAMQEEFKKFLTV